MKMTITGSISIILSHIFTDNVYHSKEILMKHMADSFLGIPIHLYAVLCRIINISFEHKMNLRYFGGTLVADT